jgi:hypothetical protein
MLSRAGMAVRSNGGFSEGCESGDREKGQSGPKLLREWM